MANLENVKILDMVNGEPTRVEYNGVVYVKTEEKAKEGDLVRVIDEDDIGYVTQGGFYKTYIDDDNDLVFEDDDGNERVYYLNDDALETFRKVSEIKVSADLVERLVELERRIEALEGCAGAKEEPKAENAPKFKVGDYVKLSIECGKRPKYGWGGVKNGDIGKVVEVEYDGTVRVDFPNQEDWHADPSELVLVTDEEVAQAKAEFKVGDYVVALPEADEEYMVTNTKMKLGKVVYIYQDGEIRIKIIAHENVKEINKEYDVNPKHFRKATDEEARWAKIGRNPGEFKKGDIVRVLKDNPYGSEKRKGDIGEITDYYNNKSFCVGTGAGWMSYEDVELIVPVNRRFDLAAEGARQ